MQSSINCILQVEDDEHNRFLLSYAFQEAGITTALRMAVDGEQAIAYLSGAGRFADRKLYPLPGLILLDLNLPGRSGLEVLTWLRGQPALRSIIVVVLTSSEDPMDAERSYQLGANSFVTKPKGLQQRIDFAKHLKSWWLECNLFAPLLERSLPVSVS